MIDTKALRRKLRSSDLMDHIDIHANVKPILAELLNRIEAAEKGRDALRTENAGLVDDMNLLRDNNTALRARIEALENQEPVAFALYSGWARKAVYLSEIEAFEQRDRRQLTADLGGSLEAYKVVPLYLAPGAQPAPSVPEGWKLVPIEPAPGMMRGAHRLVAAARRVLASADSQGLIRLDESGDVASELRSALEAAPEAKP